MKGIFKHLILCTLIFSFISITGCTLKDNSSNPVSTDNVFAYVNEINKKYSDCILSTSPYNGETKLICSEMVKTWVETYSIDPEDTTNYELTKELNANISRNSHESKPQSDFHYGERIQLSWTTEIEYDYYLLRLSTGSSLDVDEIRCDTNSFDCDTLFANSTYFWQIVCISGENKIESKIFYFFTANTPRSIKIEGVPNTRDIGGKIGSNGYVVKQGLVYRSADASDVTENGKRTANNEFKIKTEINLMTEAQTREQFRTVSPFGENVKYKTLYSLGGGSSYLSDLSVFSDAGKKCIAEEVNTFVDINNYPILFHCSAGRDRTGTLSLIILGLLGVSKKDIFMDYEMSWFSAQGSNGMGSGNAESYRAQLESLYNSFNSNYLPNYDVSFSERIEHYLTNECRISHHKLITIKQILLEKPSSSHK